MVLQASMLGQLGTWELHCPYDRKGLSEAIIVLYC